MFVDVFFIEEKMELAKFLYVLVDNNVPFSVSAKTLGEWAIKIRQEYTPVVLNVATVREMQFVKQGNHQFEQFK